MTTILILEDDYATVQLLTVSLSRKGYEIVGVATAEEGLHQIRTAPPDLVLLDLMLPGMDGLAMLEILRSDPQTALLPVIVVSARSDKKRQKEAQVLGISAYLVKPYPLSALYDAIEAALEGDE